MGALLLLHFATICVIKLSKGVGEDVCWMSHVSLALAGSGLLLRSSLYVSASLIGVLIPHSVWLFDWFGGFVVGVFPLGITAYLDGADLDTWIATAHHFYLTPVLLAAVARSRTFSAEALPSMVVLFFVLSLCSRFLLPEARNVNSAFAVIPSVQLALVRWLNDLPTAPFLVFLNAWTSLVMMGPTAMLFRWMYRPHSRRDVC